MLKALAGGGGLWGLAHKSSSAAAAGTAFADTVAGETMLAAGVLITNDYFVTKFAGNWLDGCHN